MPTLPREPSPAPRNEPHRHRHVAESFGTDAERYDRTRQPYPGALVNRLVAASPGPGILDVGCGTGIAARQFQAAGRRVLGVEPDVRMADFARRSGVEVEVATFESWDPADRTFDAVIAATAWHWVDPVAGAAKAARVLRPGSRLAPFWHVAEPPLAVTEALTAVYRRVLPDAPVNVQPADGASARTALDGYQSLFTKAADGIREAGGFTEPEQWRFDLGTVLHPGRVAGPAPHVRDSHPASTGQAGRGAGERRCRHRRDRGHHPGALHHCGGHRVQGRMSA